MRDNRPPPFRFWFIVVSTLLIGYFLSYGPMLVCAMILPIEKLEPVFVSFYSPADRLFTSGPEPLRAMYRRYIYLWIPKC